MHNCLRRVITQRNQLCTSRGQQAGQARAQLRHHRLDLRLGLFADLLGEMARGKVPPPLLLSQLGLRLVRYLPLILPLALMLSSFAHS